MLIDNEKGVVSVEYAFITIFLAIGLLLVLLAARGDLLTLYQKVAAVVLAAAGG
jgi:Flp pilus assembly pilin Flp